MKIKNLKYSLFSIAFLLGCPGSKSEKASLRLNCLLEHEGPEDSLSKAIVDCKILSSKAGVEPAYTQSDLANRLSIIASDNAKPAVSYRDEPPVGFVLTFPASIKLDEIRTVLDVSSFEFGLEGPNSAKQYLGDFTF